MLYCISIEWIIRDYPTKADDTTAWMSESLGSQNGPLLILLGNITELLVSKDGCLCWKDL